ncbi:uncharacterized protein CLUP02_15871 [Colletotrichum lupini]|uniref:Uncharacterized protein n=1 Tax=Colletotrichum lupini TaxID=145971 RepID=A0A9Q8T997_9PEZI|nr:uncharacterized protein CLUP02_15871 [Colletotrichum lupini]UQC90341.1 hypothetical protein CLUP02_15871 [Colletotrichum lupini]
MRPCEWVAISTTLRKGPPSTVFPPVIPGLSFHTLLQGASDVMDHDATASQKKKQAGKKPHANSNSGLASRPPGRPRGNAGEDTYSTHLCGTAVHSVASFFSFLFSLLSFPSPSLTPSDGWTDVYMIDDVSRINTYIPRPEVTVKPAELYSFSITTIVCMLPNGSQPTDAMGGRDLPTMASLSVLHPWDPLPSVGEHVTLSIRTALLHVTSFQTALRDICMSSLALPMKHTEVVLPMYTTYTYSVLSAVGEAGTRHLTGAHTCFHFCVGEKSCCTPYGPRLVAGFHPAPTGTSRSVTSGDNMVRTAVTYDNSKYVSHDGIQMQADWQHNDSLMRFSHCDFVCIHRQWGLPADHSADPTLTLTVAGSCGASFQEHQLKKEPATFVNFIIIILKSELLRKLHNYTLSLAPTTSTTVRKADSIST